LSGEAYGLNDWRLESEIPVGLLTDIVAALPKLAHAVNYAESGDTSPQKAAWECYYILRDVFNKHLEQ